MKRELRQQKQKSKQECDEYSAEAARAQNSWICAHSAVIISFVSCSTGSLSQMKSAERKGEHVYLMDLCLAQSKNFLWV